MKRFSLAFLTLSVLFIGFFSCKKINEATDLGGGLIPGVDNINTFETSLNTITNNLVYNDTVKVGFQDQVALGDVNDPEFGHTHANFTFTVTPASLGRNPFDTLISIDSVVLSLSYRGVWGDTLGNGIQTVRVYEVAQSSSFSDDSIYRYKDPLSDFSNQTAGGELGSKTFAIKNLKDTFTVVNPTAIKGRNDTIKLTNVLRIKFNSNALGQRFAQYDTTTNPLTGGFYLDTSDKGAKIGKAFRKLFKGLIVKAENTGNALSYYGLSDVNTRLIVYYKRKNLGDTLSTFTDFVHNSNGRANYIEQTPGGNWNTVLNNGDLSDSLIYLQSSPSGTYASIVIPALDTFDNKVIHLAEVIATIPPAYQSAVYAPFPYLFLDRKRDSVWGIFERDIPVDFQGSLSLSNFGGQLKNNTYRFNITRYVQNIVTMDASNDTLRLHAPFRTRLAIPPNNILLPSEIGLLPRISGGRVILGGGTYSVPGQALRLRIIYSNL